MQQIEKDEDVIRTEDGLVFNPYNPNNTEITLNDVQSILVRYGLPPVVFNMELYRRAFVHRSYTKRPEFENAQQHIVIVPKPADCLPLKTKSNERLEFLGDGVLELVTKYILYTRFPKAEEGFMTEKKIAIVKNEAIGKIALDMGLHRWVILSRNAEDKKTRTNLKKLGCLFEAFIGALFLNFNKMKMHATVPATDTTDTATADDNKDKDIDIDMCSIRGPGFQMAQTFIEHVFEAHVDWVALIQNDDNYKNILQVKIQKEFKVTPHYLQMSQDSLDGYKMGVFLCLGQPIHAVHFRDAIPFAALNHNFRMVHEYLASHRGKAFVFLGEGQHKIKRKAEQMACNAVLNTLQLDG